MCVCVCVCVCVCLQCEYRRQLVLSVSGSTQRQVVWVQGQGQEPRLAFSPSALQLGPCMPCGAGAMAEVRVRNPCSFPLEFYSLELDPQYRKEDQVGPFYRSALQATLILFLILVC